MKPEEMMGGQMGGDQMPTVGGAPMGDQMPQEEMRKNLLDMYGKVREKKQEWDASKNVANTNVAEAKVKALSQFFDAFQKAGIDPSDPEAMRQFFDKLYESNPDMYELIIPVIDEILGPSQEENSQMEMQGGEQPGEVGP